MARNDTMRQPLGPESGLRNPCPRSARAIELRLDDGYQRIDQALRDGADVRAWEDFWIQLLHEYETVCNELDEAA